MICDYATRYPEAVALRLTDAGTIAKELLAFFARVGVPQEILTDQGTNFTSQLMTEIYRLLQIKPIRTTPYHPQTDGLVERFNHTLKSMLKKAAKRREVLVLAGRTLAQTERIPLTLVALPGTQTEGTAVAHPNSSPPCFQGNLGVGPKEP